MDSQVWGEKLIEYLRNKGVRIATGFEEDEEEEEFVRIKIEEKGKEDKKGGFIGFRSRPEKGIKAPVLPSREKIDWQGCPVLSFSSPTGGVGRTSVCTNLVTYFACHGLKSLMIDLDLSFGDMSYMVEIPEGTSPKERDIINFYEKMKNGEIKTFHDIKKYTLGQEITEGWGRMIVRPVDSRNQKEKRISPQHIQEIIEFARSFFDVIIMDTSADIKKDPVCQKAIELADINFFVSDLDRVKTIPRLNETINFLIKKNIIQFEVTGIQKCKMIINRCLEPGRINTTPETVQKAFPAVEVISTIPNCYEEALSLKEQKKLPILWGSRKFKSGYRETFEGVIRAVKKEMH